MRILVVQDHAEESAVLAAIEVLPALVRGVGVPIDPRRVAERLNARGIGVTAGQAEDLFRRHGGGTARSCVTSAER